MSGASYLSSRAERVVEASNGHRLIVMLPVKMIL